MTDAEDDAVEVLEDLRARLGQIEQRVQERRADGQTAPRTVGLEWLDPPFASGHWVPEQIRRAGGWELLGREGDRSVETTWEAVRDVDPEMLVLMACGFHVDEAVREWARSPRPDFWPDIEAVRRGQVFAVDGSAYFSRPGPRVIDGISILAEIFDPDGFVEQSPIGSWTPDRLTGCPSALRSTACGAAVRGRSAIRPTSRAGRISARIASAGPATTAFSAFG